MGPDQASAICVASLARFSNSSCHLERRVAGATCTAVTLYSGQLVAFVRRVLDIVPRTMFDKMKQHKDKRRPEDEATNYVSY